MTPPNDMIMWLREVLITANTQELPAVAARVLAERAIIDLHKPEPLETIQACSVCDQWLWARGMTAPPGTPDAWPCDTLRWLAYGHRYDAPGWQHVWTPEDLA